MIMKTGVKLVFVYIIWMTAIMKPGECGVLNPPNMTHDYCAKLWFREFPKCGKYNLDLNKLKEMAKKDNIEEYEKITNINKKHFFDRWIYEHAKVKLHIKALKCKYII